MIRCIQKKLTITAIVTALGLLASELGAGHPDGSAKPITEAAEAPSPDAFWIPQIGHGTAGSNQFSTDFSFINLSNTTAVLEITTFSGDGSPADLLRVEGFPGPAVASSALQTVVDGKGMVQARSLSPDPENELIDGWAKVSTQGKIGVEVVFRIVDASTGQLTTSANIRVGPLTTAASLLAVVDPPINTGVAILNPPTNPGEATVVIEVLNSSGTFVGTASLKLVPGQKVAQFLDKLVPGLSAHFSGSVDIRSDLPVAVLPLRQEGVVLTTQDTFPGR